MSCKASRPGCPGGSEPWHASRFTEGMWLLLLLVMMGGCIGPAWDPPEPLPATVTNVLLQCEAIVGPVAARFDVRHGEPLCTKEGCEEQPDDFGRWSTATWEFFRWEANALRARRTLIYTGTRRSRDGCWTDFDLDPIENPEQNPLVRQAYFYSIAGDTCEVEDLPAAGLLLAELHDLDVHSDGDWAEWPMFVGTLWFGGDPSTIDAPLPEWGPTISEPNRIESCPWPDLLWTDWGQIRHCIPTCEWHIHENTALYNEEPCSTSIAFENPVSERP